MVETFNEEPSGEEYYHLLRFALDYCDKMMLVIRQERTLTLGVEGQLFLNRLEPFLLEERQTNEWPGTALLKDTALVREYIYNKAAESILEEYTSHLYQWLQPALPEDLCLLKIGTSSPWLVTIAHEKDAYLDMTTDERNALVRKYPELLRLLREDIVRK